MPLLSNESDRIIPIDWSAKPKEVFNVLLKVIGEDYKGWLKDISECISKQNINITSVDIKVNDRIAEARFMVQVKSSRQLNRLIKRMLQLKNIDSVIREGR